MTVFRSQVVHPLLQLFWAVRQREAEAFTTRRLATCARHTKRRTSRLKRSSRDAGTHAFPHDSREPGSPRVSGNHTRLLEQRRRRTRGVQNVSWFKTFCSTHSGFRGNFIFSLALECFLHQAGHRSLGFIHRVEYVKLKGFVFFLFYHTKRKLHNIRVQSMLSKTLSRSCGYLCECMSS